MTNIFKDHNADHAKDSENWDLYRKNVVEFLLDRCRLANVYSSEEIFHVLGILDVNSVAIHASAMVGNGGQQNDARPGMFICSIHSLLQYWR